MDLAYALDVAYRVQVEATKQRFLEQISAVANAYNVAANQPSASADEAFKVQLTTFYAVLDGSEINEWPEADFRAVRHLNLEMLTPSALRASVARILADNNSTRSLGAQSMMALFELVRRHSDALANLLAATSALEVRGERRADAHTEVALLMPQDGATLATFRKDIEGFERLFTRLNELHGHVGESAPIVALERGSLAVEVQSYVEVVKTLLEIVAAVLTVRLSARELKKKATELRKEDDLDPDLIAKIESAADARTERVIKELSEKIAARGVSDDEGRRNELQNGLSLSIRFVAEKLEEGVRIEVTPARRIAQVEPENERAPEQVAALENELAALRAQALAVEKIEHQTIAPRAIAHESVPPK